MPSAVSGRQWPAESPQKKTSRGGGLPQPVRDPVALVALGRQVEPLGQLDGRLLDVEARVEAADADPELVVGGEAPAVAGGDDAALDPDLEVVAAAAGMDLEAARERRVGRLVAVVEDPAPAERVDDQRRLDGRRGRSRPRSSRRPDRRRRGPRPWPSRSRRRTAPRAGRRAPGSRTSRSSRAGACGCPRAGCGRRARRRSA